MLIGFGGSCPYIIGDIIHSESSTFDPNKTYLGTDWSRIKGRVITGVDEAQTEFSSTNKMGGAKTINISHIHTTGSLALTVAQMPIHKHGQIFSLKGTAQPGGEGRSPLSSNISSVVSTKESLENSGEGQTHNHGNTGSAGNSTQSILSPYVTKYIWERIA